MKNKIAITLMKNPQFLDEIIEALDEKARDIDMYYGLPTTQLNDLALMRETILNVLLATDIFEGAEDHG